MFITKYLIPKSDLHDTLFRIFQELYSVNENEAAGLVRRVIPHTDALIDDLYCSIEYPYIDKVYRDSYYNYYSSKLREYSKEAVKISFFSGVVKDSDFSNADAIKDLKGRFKGFIVLRPIHPKIIGRSVISPLALKNKNFACRTVDMHTSVNSIDFVVEGFPHSTQDSETTTCSETSLWALMEYFGHKYPDYTPTLPSKIMQTVRGMSNERLLPTEGILVTQIAFALKEFGFGTKIYTHKSPNFYSTLSTYIESGVPLILGLDNRHKTIKGRNGTIGHAVTCIGHEVITNNHFDRLGPSTNDSFDSLNKKGVLVFDNDEISKDFIFIDDNYPPYQRANLYVPCSYYGSEREEWQKCDITCFVTPLHSKIYVEAKNAKVFVGEYLSLTFNIPRGSEIFLRLFLASSKSFKEEVSLNLNYPARLREQILKTSMPKFIWIAELSTKALKKQDLNNGVIILDATETITRKCLLIAAYMDKMIFEDPETLKIKPETLSLQEFKSYNKNLKSF